MTTDANDSLSALDAAQAAADAAMQSASAVAGGVHGGSILWTPDLVRFLALAIMLFTFGALLLGTLLLWRSKSGSAQILRVLGVLTIIGVSALLLVVGYSNEQLTPIVGLFGAIAGYLLGKDVPTMGFQGDGQAAEKS